MSEKIKDCNCDTPKHDVRVRVDLSFGVIYIQCDSCGTRTAEYDTREKAVEAWNSNKRE